MNKDYEFREQMEQLGKIVAQLKYSDVLGKGEFDNEKDLINKTYISNIMNSNLTNKLLNVVNDKLIPSLIDSNKMKFIESLDNLADNLGLIFISKSLYQNICLLGSDSNDGDKELSDAIKLQIQSKKTDVAVSIEQIDINKFYNFTIGIRKLKHMNPELFHMAGIKRSMDL